jgi:oxygen-dependent protoporphyrinogen oxidase
MIHLPCGTINTKLESEIFGAGIAGLLLSWESSKKNLPFTLYEKEHRAGGLIRSEQTPQGLTEHAANAVFMNNVVKDYLEALNIKAVPNRPKLKRMVFRKGSARAFPFTFPEIIRAGLGLMRPLPLNIPHLSVADFFSPLLGRTATNEVLSTALSGIYAARANELHFASIFDTQDGALYLNWFLNLIKNMRQNGRPVTHSFTSGMEELVGALTSKIKNNLELNSTKTPDFSKNVILCTNAPDAAELLNGELPQVSALLRQIEYIPIKMATFFFDHPLPVLENTFGLLFAPGQGFSNSGILHNTAIFPDRTKSDGVFSYTFISTRPGDHRQQIETDLKKLNFKEIPLEARFASYERGIPKYNLKRFQTMDRIQNLLPPGVMLFGNYVEKISMRDMITIAKNWGETL